MSFGLKSYLPDNLTCPLCDQQGIPEGETVTHFDQFIDIVVEKDRRWVLGFVCEEHHHWALELNSHSGGMWITVRQLSCPGPETCFQAHLENDADPAS